MPETPTTILAQAARLVHDAEIAKADAHPGAVEFDADQSRGEVSVSGTKGRLSVSAYASSRWISIKTLAAGVRGVWRFKK
jgi:hypothetical protein